MLNCKTFLALSTVALITACAGPGQPRAGMEQPAGSRMHQSTDARMQQHMQAMQAEMRGATSMEECQAIMTRHMQAMHGSAAMQPGMGMGMSPDMMDMCTQHMQRMQGGTPGTQGMQDSQGQQGQQGVPASPAPAR